MRTRVLVVDIVDIIRGGCFRQLEVAVETWVNLSSTRYVVHQM